MAGKHQKQWDFLKNKYESGQLAHSYLFTGIKNIGKKNFALEFAEFIGCKFPDLKIVSEANKKDEKFGDGGEIKISQIKNVQNFLSYKSYNGGYKTVIICEAEKMNAEAQNCFLKTLEEPKGDTLLILVTSKPDLLLPTIKSRCQQIKFFGMPQISQEQEAQEKEILKEIKPVILADLSEKFKYAKAQDFDEKSLSQILEVMQKYFREKMLSGDQDAVKTLKLIEEINFKMATTNASPKLALEVLLMQL